MSFAGLFRSITDQKDQKRKQQQQEEEGETKRKEQPRNLAENNNNNNDNNDNNDDNDDNVRFERQPARKPEGILLHPDKKSVQAAKRSIENSKVPPSNQNTKKRRRASSSFSNNHTSHDIDATSSQQQQQQQSPPPHKRHDASSRNRPNSTKQSTHLRPRVTPQALALSAQLKELSRQKRLDDVLQLYYQTTMQQDKQDRILRDEHHASIVVDCCARCGNLQQAEQIVHEFSQPTSVALPTALLKAYAHAGGARALYQSQVLFAAMCGGNRGESGGGGGETGDVVVTAHATPNQPERQQQQQQERPNVRTLNTVLRGCLWTAASRINNNNNNHHTNSNHNNPNHDGSVTLAGGMATAQRVWTWFGQTVGPSALDLSSYEYYITLLCQALRIDEAQASIAELLQRHDVRIKSTAKLVAGTRGTTLTQPVLETIAIVHVALARAHAMMGQTNEAWLACQRALHAVKGSLDKFDKDETTMTTATTTTVAGPESSAPAAVGKKSRKKQKIMSLGGKRGWHDHSSSAHPSVSTPSHDDEASRREASNAAYRKHRLAELQADILKLLQTSARKSITPSPWADRHVLSQRLVTRLLYLSGGGTTDLSAVVDKEGNKQDRSSKDIMKDTLVANWFSFGLKALADDSLSDEKALKSPLKILNGLGMDKANMPFAKDGTMDLAKLFDDGTSKPVDVELGAGFGDWIVHKAQSDTTRNYIAVELRADRVHQIFSRATLESSPPLDNLCIVGCECGRFLRYNLKQGSVSTIYANHPEPPTQTHGINDEELRSIIAGGLEPAHMLNSQTLIAAAKCLQPDGKLVIVSDNKWYARFLAATMARVVRQKLLRSPYSSELVGTGLQQLESFGGVVLYQVRSNNKGATWFDRLWNTGAGTHAELKTRFVLCMYRQ